MPQIDRTGAFIATITEAAFGTTKKDLPQAVFKLLATKRYVTDKDEMAQFSLTEPGWVDWNYGDEIMAFLVLFNESGPLKNYEQIQLATGWNGNDFQELSLLVGKSVLIRVEENTYQEKTSLQVNWIDAPDASPERTIKQADAATVAAANSKWLKGKTAPVKPAVAAKPALPAKPAPAAPSAVTPPVTAAPAAVAPAPTTAPAAPSVAAVPPAKATPPKRTKKTPETPAAPAATGISQAEAWAAVSDPAVKKTLDDGAIEDAWITAAAAIAPGIEDAAVTPEQWVKVRDAVLADINARLA
jgi:hypothetical protein